ncbi:MAG: carbon storage regulator [Candidatus Eremiobacteraeota bacterium]|nr:carbon storage regulator [Candidatus Eremiobacteraeota bacterium]
MLVISRKKKQSLRVGDDVVITVLESRADQVRLGIEAPREVSVVRGELLEEVRRQNQAASDVLPEELEAFRRQLLDQMSEGREPPAFAALRRMADRVAHDLRNVLAGVKGEAELALLDCNQPEVTEGLQSILESCRKLEDRANAFSVFYGAIEQAMEGTVLGPLLNNLSRFVKERSPLTRCEIKCPPSLTLLARSSVCEEMLREICQNALEAMPSNGGWLGLEAEDSPDGWLRLSVSDSGHGMDRNTIRHLFEPFYTTRLGQPGLGLARVYGWVRSLGGKIEVESSLGQGTSLTLVLPRAGTAASPGGKECILLLGKFEGVLHRQLEEAGYRVLMAENREQLMYLARHSNANVLVTEEVPSFSVEDLGLEVVAPGASGEVLRTIRRALATPQRFRR